MARRFNLISTAIVLSILAAALWIFAKNIFVPDASSGRAAGMGSTSAEDAGSDDANELPFARGSIDARNLSIGPTGLAVPVDGVGTNQLADSYHQERGGGSRVHNALDIMAPVGRPVVSVGPGTVEKMFFSKGGGGNTVYVRSPDGKWMFYYAHLDAYAPGLREGQRVGRGTPLGTVGISGNANPAGPHLHFAIHRMAPGEKWYDGTPVNPYPLLVGKSASR